ncbi:hypothetical protein vcoNHCC006C_003456C, partial [Vibrio cholerae O1 str. NHCC-006C]
SPLGGR